MNGEEQMLIWIIGDEFSCHQTCSSHLFSLGPMDWNAFNEYDYVKYGGIYTRGVQAQLVTVKSVSSHLPQPGMRII